MKKRGSLERTLAALRKAEERLQELQERAAAERARALAKVHRQLGFASRNELIEALTELEGGLARRVSSGGSQAVARLLSTTSSRTKSSTPAERVPSAAASVGDASDAVQSGSVPNLSTGRPALGAMRASSDSSRARGALTSEQTEPPVVLPIEVQRLLDFSAPHGPRWEVPEERHTIVVEILTRGDVEAERWLWEQDSKEAVRSLIRRFGGAGCDDEARATLRQKLGLSERDVPTRPLRGSMARRALVSAVQPPAIISPRIHGTADGADPGAA